MVNTIVTAGSYVLVARDRREVSCIHVGVGGIHAEYEEAGDSGKVIDLEFGDRHVL